MTQIYKVIKPVEIGNKNYRLGEEVALKGREAEELMQKGFIANTRNGFPDTAVADAKKKGEKPEQSREPDMKDEKDKEMVDEANTRAEEKQAERQAKEEEKQEAKDEREAERDEALEAKREEALALAAEVGRDDTDALAAMGEAELDKEIKDMQGAKAAEAKEETKTEEKKPAKKATEKSK